MKHWRPDAWLVSAIVLHYTIVGLVILRPEAVYSGDIGVKYVQAQALVDHHFRSLHISYPGEFLDPERRFFPLRPPFVMVVDGKTQAIFSPASTVVQAAAVAVAGFRGMIAVTLISAAVILYSVRRLSPQRDVIVAVLAIGLASPLWFYAVNGWEHAPGIALGILGFAVGMTSTGRTYALLAGASIGAGATIRDEIILLLPGLAVAVWLRTREWRPVAAVFVGAIAPLAGALVLEVWWFERPAAAHVRHAVHVLQAALNLTAAPNPDIPVLHPLTLHDRYAFVVQYWLFGYGNDNWILAFVGAGIIALAVRRVTGSSIAVFAWLLGILVLALLDFHELMTAPKWLAGLHRVAPYAVLALLPRPRESGENDGRLPLVALVTTAIYLVIAFVGADTDGGKALGPRLLLPLLPLLIVAAVVRIGSYVRSGVRLERWVGILGVVLLCLSLAMHVFGTLPAYRYRNKDDSGALIALALSRVRIVVADDVFTAQLLMPLYGRKLMFLADSPGGLQELSAQLASHRINEFVLVSRRPQDVAPEPFRLAVSEPQGRMLLKYYRR